MLVAAKSVKKSLLYLLLTSDYKTCLSHADCFCTQELWGALMHDSGGCIADSLLPEARHGFPFHKSCVPSVARGKLQFVVKLRRRPWPLLFILTTTTSGCACCRWSCINLQKKRKKKIIRSMLLARVSQTDKTRHLGDLLLFNTENTSRFSHNLNKKMIVDPHKRSSIVVQDSKCNFLTQLNVWSQQFIKMLQWCPIEMRIFH